MHVAYSNDETARAAYAERAGLDWHNFVAFRGRELAPDGRLVVMTMALDEDGTSGFHDVARRDARGAACRTGARRSAQQG